MAMVGKDCVAIACDLRLGLQSLTVSNNFPKIFSYGDVYLGLTGLATDVATVSDLFRYKVNMYRLREERQISPQTMANLVSTSLYEKRFGPYFISPVIAGINHTSGKPFICGFDSIGCIDFAKDFIVSGTASDQLFGTCEGLWEPDLVRLHLDVYTASNLYFASAHPSLRSLSCFFFFFEELSIFLIRPNCGGGGSRSPKICSKRSRKRC